MKNQRLKAVALSTVLSAGALMGSVAQADQTLDSILKVGQTKTTVAQESQKRIDRLAQETDDLVQQFKHQNRLIADLRMYNSQLERQVTAQTRVLQELEESVEQVTVIERQIQPLIVRMLDGLEQFVALDKPFRLQERKDRIETLRRNQDRADISVSEKFRQVLEAYKIESEYGRFLDTYNDTLSIDGQDREVSVLQVGRLALIYQTSDANHAGVWDSVQNQWVALDGSYRTAILKGFRIARNQVSPDTITVPVQAPEAAR
jgi:predicted RNase H-like nuclease (RuvC/YqgF family)